MLSEGRVGGDEDVAGNGSVVFCQIYFMATGLKEKAGEEVRLEDEICLFGSSCYSLLCICLINVNFMSERGYMA